MPAKWASAFAMNAIPPSVMTPPFRICATGRPGNRLPEAPALVVGMLRLEGVHERRHSEEVIAANEEHELGIG